ncbi:uncharacterized protein LOC62_02G003371 [Vanrija pseudolonga]|uniref:Uncharacterized protein n=1 Tax=Vanrija pseudolonga TaxID=143232 RepID=A0AAF1BGJ2_9TREE|nr:hypothetical protein LOC62_02G003371 [Vanrija pseudolonga]
MSQSIGPNRPGGPTQSFYHWGSGKLTTTPQATATSNSFNTSSALSSHPPAAGPFEATVRYSDVSFRDHVMSRYGHALLVGLQYADMMVGDSFTNAEYAELEEKWMGKRVGLSWETASKLNEIIKEGYESYKTSNFAANFASNSLNKLMNKKPQCTLMSFKDFRWWCNSYIAANAHITKANRDRTTTIASRASGETVDQ